MAELSIPRYDELSRNTLPNYVNEDKVVVRQVVLSKDNAVKPVMYVIIPNMATGEEVTLQRVDVGDCVYRNTYTETGISYSVHKVHKDPTGRLALHRDKLNSISLNSNTALNPTLIEFLSPSTEEGLTVTKLPDGQGWENGITINMQRKRMELLSFVSGYGLVDNDLELLLDTGMRKSTNFVYMQWYKGVKLPLASTLVFSPPPENEYDYWMFINTNGERFGFVNQGFNQVEYIDPKPYLENASTLRVIRATITFSDVVGEPPTLTKWMLYTVPF